MIESNLLENSSSCCNVKQWCGGREGMSPLTYWFKDENHEREYRRQRDEQYPCYVIISSLLYATMFGMQIAYLPRSIIVYSCFAAGMTCLVIFAVTSWLASRTKQEEEPSDIVIPSREIRIGVYVITVLLAIASSVVSLVDLDHVNRVPVYGYSGIISLTIGWVHLRTGSSLKLCMMLLSIVILIAALTQSPIVAMYYSDPTNKFSGIQYVVQIGYLLLLVSSILHVLDRQIEFMSRTNFLWKNKLKVEQDEVETMRGINKILLENILPAHVADHFLLTTRTTQELYHESYNSIAVLFASIPNYKEFYDETDINKQGLECLRLLNEIICDFDKLLLKPKFSGIEKIKTIGSTYMLASGLSPGKEIDPSKANAIKQQDHNVIVLVDFAIALMTILDQINGESFQRFQLRMGLNHGPVIAGVVGAQKPQYDIWGNTVNVASRMDSCGEMGKLQVTEDTAKVLQQAGYELTCRGPIYVKGKGTLTTYFVKTPFDT